MEDRQPDYLIEAEELLVPVWPIASNPSIRLNEIRAKRYYIVDRSPKASMVAEPFIEIEDFTSEEFWPEWRVVFHNEDEVFVKARTEDEAQRAADDLRSQG